MTDDQHYKLNPFMRVSFHPSLRCDLLLENEEFILPNPDFINLLGRIEGEHRTKDLVALASTIIDKDEAANIIENLKENNILVPSDRHYPEMDGVRHWIKRGWLDALILHLKSRNLYFSDTGNGSEGDSRQMTNEMVRSGGLPAIWKTFEAKPEIPLPPPISLPDKKIEEVLLYRRSNRPWRGSSLSLDSFSSILYHANIELRRVRLDLEQNLVEQPELLLNSSFSALETYCVVLAVDGLTNGLYHYDPKNHKLKLLREGLFRDEIVKCCIGQSRPHGASCIFLITSVWERFMFRYRHPRAYRTLLTNVAELGHKYILLATAMKLSTFMTPAFDDAYVDDFMQLDAFEEATLYAVGIG